LVEPFLLNLPKNRGHGTFLSFSRNSSPLLSIFSAPDDYKMNDPAGKAVLLAPTRRRRTMKYICLGYLEPGKFEGMTEDERNAVLDECFEHNDHLRANGHLVGVDPVLEKRQSRDHAWPLCGNQGTAWRHSNP
jgi:hypothetical protein